MDDGCLGEVSDELIESGQKLKITLKAGRYICRWPLKIFVNRDTFLTAGEALTVISKAANCLAKQTCC